MHLEFLWHANPTPESDRTSSSNTIAVANTDFPKPPKPVIALTTNVCSLSSNSFPFTAAKASGRATKFSGNRTLGIGAPGFITDVENAPGSDRPEPRAVTFLARSPHTPSQRSETTAALPTPYPLPTHNSQYSG